MKHVRKARFELIVSMVVFGTLGVFVREIALPSGELALYRAVLAVLLLTAFLLPMRQKTIVASGKDKRNLFVTGREAFLLLISGAAMGINWILLFEAYRFTTVSVATLSYYFAPVIVTVFCPFLFREKPAYRQILCFVMSTIGVILLIGLRNLQGGGRNLMGVLLGLGAAVFYASVILLNKFIKGVSGIWRTYFQFFAAIAVLLPYVMRTGGFHFATLSGKSLVNLLIVGLVHTGITYCLYFSALKELPGQEAAVLSYIDPMTAVFLSVLFLGETITWSQIIGGALILGFAVWNEILAERKEKV